jgi:hypothetical protein
MILGNEVKGEYDVLMGAGLFSYHRNKHNWIQGP